MTTRTVYGKGEAIIPFFINATDLAAGTTQYLPVPHTGVIKEICVVVQTAIVTGGSVKAKVGSTDVVGATVTVADSATVGTVYDASVALEEPTAVVTKGTAIQIIPAAAFNGGGAVNGFVRLVGKL